MLASAKPARPDRSDANAWTVQRDRTITGVGDLRRIGAGHQFRLRIGKLNSEGANTGLERLRSEHREARRPLLRQVAIIGLERARDMKAPAIQRLAGDEIDRPRNPPVNHVGGGVFEHFDPAEQFGRDVVERQFAATVGREDVAAVKLGADERQAADDHARSLNRETVGIVALFETGDVDARNALQRFGDRTVGQRANVLGRDDVDERVGVALDLLRALERFLIAGDHDLFAVGRTRGLVLGCGGGALRLGIGRLRGKGAHRKG